MSIIKLIKRILKPFIFKVPQLTKMYKLVRDSQINVGIPKETPFGFKFSGNSEIGMEQGTFEMQEVEIFKKCLEHVDTFVNIGANVGYYCCIALQKGKPTIAFEPIDKNLINLYANIKANNWDNNIEIFPLALGDKIEIAEIYGEGTGASLIKGWAGTSEFDKRLIPVTTLDSVLTSKLKDKKCFFLVDIEGFEKSMLQGSTMHLTMNPKPIWMIEITITAHQPKGTFLNPNFERTFEIFWEKDYQAWTVGDQFRLVSKEEIKKICKTGKNTLLTHNFLFIDKDDASKIYPNRIS